MPAPKEPKKSTRGSGHPDKVTVVAPGTTIQRAATAPFLVRGGAPNPAEMRRLLATDQYAITPGGIRPKSMIHIVEPGEIIARDGVSFKRFDTQTLEFVEPAYADAEPLELPALGSGWIVFAYFIESAANVIASMTTSWAVPAAPTAHDGQLIYLFNGLQDIPVTHILQPVLQWGVSPDGGGPSWAVASWFVDSSGNAFKTPLVNVRAGDVLTGVMRMTGRNGSQFNYSAEFAGIPGTLLNVNGANQLVNPNETLECYSLSSCADYPATLLTSMRAIDVTTATGSIGLSFSPVNSVTDCGQHAVVMSDAATAGQVDLYYRSQLGSVGSTGIACSNQFGLHEQTDVFAIDSNGALHVAWVVGAGVWNRPFPISAPGLFPPGAGIAASNQFGLNHQTDVFVVDKNGALTVSWVVDAGVWNGPIAISPPGTFPPGAALAVSKQFGLDQQTDVFAIDNNGALRVAWVVGAGNWNPPVAISRTGMFPPGAPLAASNQFGLNHQTDVFVVDRSGALTVAWVVDAGVWNGLIEISPRGTFPAGAALAASNQFGLDQQTDVFGIDENGALRVAWVVAAGIWNPPFPISHAGMFRPGAGIAASNQFGLSHQTDVFIVDESGALNVAWVVNAGAWNGPIAISRPGIFSPGATLAACNQFGLNQQTDVFALGQNGSWNVSWVVGAGTWNGPVSFS